jgi:hypothetical protein
MFSALGTTREIWIRPCAGLSMRHQNACYPLPLLGAPGSVPTRPSHCRRCQPIVRRLAGGNNAVQRARPGPSLVADEAVADAFDLIGDPLGVDVVATVVVLGSTTIPLRGAKC